MNVWPVAIPVANMCHHRENAVQRTTHSTCIRNSSFCHPMPTTFSSDYYLSSSLFFWLSFASFKRCSVDFWYIGVRSHRCQGHLVCPPKHPNNQFLGFGNCVVASVPFFFGRQSTGNCNHRCEWLLLFGQQKQTSTSDTTEQQSTYATGECLKMNVVVIGLSCLLG